MSVRCDNQILDQSMYSIWRIYQLFTNGTQKQIYGHWSSNTSRFDVRLDGRKLNYGLFMVNCQVSFLLSSTLHPLHPIISPHQRHHPTTITTTITQVAMKNTSISSVTSNASIYLSIVPSSLYGYMTATSASIAKDQGANDHSQETSILKPWGIYITLDAISNSRDPDVDINDNQVFV